MKFPIPRICSCLLAVGGGLILLDAVLSFGGVALFGLVPGVQLVVFATAAAAACCFFLVALFRFRDSFVSANRTITKILVHGKAPQFPLASWVTSFLAMSYATLFVVLSGAILAGCVHRVLLLCPGM